MKYTKMLIVVLAVAVLAAVPFVSAGKALATGNPHEFKQLSLQYAVDDSSADAVWTHVPGNEVSGFKLSLTRYQSAEWIYLNVRTINPVPAEGLYGFSLVQENLPDGWSEFWAAKGAVSDGTDVQKLLFAISTGTSPIFYLSVDEEGQVALLDGLLHDLPVGAQDSLLRVEPGYLLGTYSYTNTALGNMQITFR